MMFEYLSTSTFEIRPECDEENQILNEFIVHWQKGIGSVVIQALDLKAKKKRVLTIERFDNPLSAGRLSKLLTK